MRRATSIRRAGHWPASHAIDAITLDYTNRHRRRLQLITSGGLEIMLDLPQAVHLRDGDALLLHDGAFIAIRAMAETLLEIRAPDPGSLARLAWHLGNRHLAVQFLPVALRILDDHVIAAMITNLGGTTCQIDAAFDPEPGAYHHG